MMMNSGIVLEILVSMMEQRSIGIWSSNLGKTNVVSTTLQSDKQQIEEGTVKTKGILRYSDCIRFHLIRMIAK